MSEPEFRAEVAPLVEVSGNVARLEMNGEVSEHEIKELPPNFVRWQLDYKRGIYDAIEKNEYVAFNAGHLPVVGTWNEDSDFPNLANKGVGFTPKDEHIEHYLGIIEEAVREIEKLGPTLTNETRALRVGAARQFYAHPEHIDWRRLQLLEIFEGGTYRNLCRNPRAAVLWTGNSPIFMSFQVDCLVEVITPEHPRYRFAWAMRRLFEYEPFHVVQTIFPYAYTLWVHDWNEKTPKRRYK
jgi:hypothetical protein